MIAPGVSVILPTRNRPTFARLALECAIGGTSSDVQIVVADNSDEPVAFGPVPARVTVLRPERRVLPMSDNWERGLAAATGEWLIVQGDKHRLVPGAIDALLNLVSGVRAVRYRVPAFEQSLADEQVEDVAQMRHATGKLFGADEPFRTRVLPGGEILREWFKNVEYRFDLPMLYNTMVHRSVVRLVIRQFGRFFDSVSPDVSSSLVFGSQLDSYLETSLPAVMLHWPNSNIGRWSNGANMLLAGQLNRTFVTEMGANPIAEDGLPDLFASIILFEYRHFLRKWPAYRRTLRMPWRAFVENGIQEVARTRVPRERAALIRQIFQASQSEGREIEPLAFGMIEVGRRIAGDVRRRVLGPRQPKKAPPSFMTVEGLIGANAVLAKKLGESSAPASSRAEEGVRAASPLS